MKRKLGYSVVAAVVVAVLAIGGAVLAPAPAEAGPPGPQCGPAILWICSSFGGPDILFAGTVCEKEEFEKENGVTCVPYGG